MPGTAYSITYSTAQRSGYNQPGGESWNVLIDNEVIQTNNTSGASYADTTATFTATATTHTLSFVGTDLVTGDNTVFIDNVRITPSLKPLISAVTLNSPANNAGFLSSSTVNPRCDGCYKRQHHQRRAVLRERDQPRRPGCLGTLCLFLEQCSPPVPTALSPTWYSTEELSPVPPPSILP